MDLCALERKGESKHVRRSDIYFLGRIDDNKENKRKRWGRRRARGNGKKLCREYAPLLLMPLRPCPRPHPAISFLPSYCRWSRSCKAQPRGRRCALCVSENVALIGGSVAVMRYQLPANKRINVKRWRWMRRRRKLARRMRVRGWRRQPRTREREKGRRGREVVSPPNSRRAEQLKVLLIQCFD